MDSMSELKRHVTVTKAPVEFIRFVPRSTIQNNIWHVFDFESNAYPRDSEHINRASKLLNKLIITYFYTKAWTSPDIRKCLELMPDESEDYDDVINLICKEKNLKNAELLVLILQINEFHSANYWTVTLLHIISSPLLKGTLIIAICTSTTPSQIAELDDDRSCKISALQYKTINLHLSPLDFEDSIQLFDRFIDIFQVKAILMIQSRYTVNSQFNQRNSDHNRNCNQNFYATQLKQSRWKKTGLKAYEKLDSFTTIQDFETSGLILLEQFGKHFIPRAPLVLVSILVDYLKLFDIFDESLLRLFELLTEETFPQFVLYMHHVTYSLALRTSSTITIRDIYGGCVRGTNRVLDCNIDVRQQIEYYAHASLIPKTENGFSKPGLLDRTKLPIIVSNKNGFKEI
ncbi:8617_t:CDS:2, partial [Gigaspora margarita]